MSNISVIGAGNVGEALAKRFAECGHIVKVANSRGPHSLREFARRTGAQPVDIHEAASGTDVVVVAIPFARVGTLPQSLFAALPANSIVVDAGNYYPLRDGLIRGIDRERPESEWVAERLGVPVAKAFNNIIASRLTTEHKPKGAAGRIALPVSADDPAARAKIMTLVDEIGFDAFDAGPVAQSWRQQPGMPAYCTDPTREELARLLEQADRVDGTRNRDRGSRIMARLPANYPADQLVAIARFSVGMDRLKMRSWLAMLRLGVALSLASVKTR